MKIIELFWLFMTVLISLVFVVGYGDLAFREKILYLVALLLSTFLYSFRRYSRLAQKRLEENDVPDIEENDMRHND